MNISLSGFGKSQKKIIILLVVLFIVALFFLLRKSKEQAPYFALFLDNGQVYFGKLKIIDKQTVSLREIHYIATNNLAALELTQNSTSSSELSLVKLGGELHGPTDEMIVNRDHVLFWEELRTNSKIVDAILKYKP